MRKNAKTVLITGASRGIGEAVAMAFARNGANLALVARSKADLERVAGAARPLGVQVVVSPANVARHADVERSIMRALEAFGRIDVLVNAAGMYGPIGPLAESDMEHWAVALETNLFGTVFALRKVLPGMIARREGSIINFSGGGAVSPFPRFSAYSASKAAVVRLTETVAEEVKEYGVRVNAIAPGAVNTRMLDEALAAGEQRVGKEFYAKVLEQKAKGGTPPERAAELAVFLASPEAAGITGRLISAVWDDWKSLAGRGAELAGSAMFTLRRIDGRNFTEMRAEVAR
jgi:NAD(P)-dependent dehydrogenase (short-subunit alcohol dehydrogenase family)